jgi:thiamine kinase-like enzyme
MSSVLLAPPPQPRLHVIDFEFSHLGHRAVDLGQLIGDLLENVLLAGPEISTRIPYKVMIEAFAKGYGALSDDMAYRVIVHAGVHVVNWCARHPGAEISEQVALMMREAVEVIVRAGRREREWFEGKLLGCLLATPT